MMDKKIFRSEEEDLDENQHLLAAHECRVGAKLVFARGGRKRSVMSGDLRGPGDHKDRPCEDVERYHESG